MMKFWWSLEILFSCKSLHVRENRFTPALGQNITGHRILTHSVLSTCQTLMWSYPFFIASMLQELHCTDLLISVMSNRSVLFTNPGIFGEGEESVSINTAQYPSLCRHFNTFHKHSFLFFFYFFIFHHQWTEHQFITIAINSLFCFFIFLLFSFLYFFSNHNFYSCAFSSSMPQNPKTPKPQNPLIIK